MGAVVYLTFLETSPLKTVEVQAEYLDYFTRNIQSFGLSSIYVVSEKNDIRKRYFKLARK